MIAIRPLIVAPLALLAAAAPAEADGLPDVAAPPAQLRFVDATRSHGARFLRFRQEIAGIPVLGAEAVITGAPGRRGDLLLDHTRGGIAAPPVPAVTRAVALSRASPASRRVALRASPRAKLAILLDRGRGRLVWRVLLAVQRPLASFEVLVDARSGAIVRVRDLLLEASGAARIFDPNPITAQGFRGGLADNNDADSPALTALRTAVTLEHLDGSTCLVGQWAHATLPPLSAPPLGEVCAPGSDFSTVTRSDLRFEAVMAYFHIDRAQAYVHSLGFTNAMNRQLRIHANATPDNNSYYDLIARDVTFGTGGVDDAEDADSIVHEYGHAIQHDQAPGLTPAGETGAIMEGFADYFAAALAATFAPHHGEFDACMSEWDVTTDPGSPACVRRTDKALTPVQVEPACAGEIHCVGEVWSGALWAIRQRLGGQNADRLVIQSHFSYPSTPGFADASRALLAADRQLYGGVHRDALVSVLAERGLVDPERLDDSPGEATRLAVPGTARGRVDAAADPRDFYRLALPAGRGIVVRMTAPSGELDVRLLRPGALAANERDAVVAGSTNPGGAESFAYTPPTAADYSLEVSASAGAGDYVVEALVDADGDTQSDVADNCVATPNSGQEDRDRDGRGDACDNCPLAANAGQANWDGDRAGDACDRSSRATLDRVVLRGSGLSAYGRLLPTSLPLRAWRVAIQRRTCTRSGCRFRPMREVAASRRSGTGMLAVAGRLRPGKYRLYAVVRAPRYSAARSRAVRVSVRR
jgi:hypothetical protein